MAQNRRGVEVSPDDKKTKISKEAASKVLKIFAFTKPYRGIFFLGMVFMVLSFITSFSFPTLLGYIIKVIQGEVKDYTVNQVTLAIIGVLVLQGVFSFMRIYLFARVSERTMADIRRLIYSKVITLPVHFFEKRRVGELTSRITSDVGTLSDVLSFTLAEFFRQAATLVVGVPFLLYFSWKLAIFMLATFPVMIVAAMFFGRYIRKLSKQAQDNLAEANVIVEETLQSVNTVKAFTNEQLEIDRYAAALKKVIDSALQAATFRGSFVSFIILALFGGIIGVVWYGAGLVQEGRMAFSELFTFIIYTMYIGGSVGGLGEVYAQIQRTLGASERLLEILEEKSEINLDRKTDKSQPVISGDLSFQNIEFSYPSRADVEVLKGVSFDVAAGKKIAFVGYSGAGKSTIVQLLMRYYEPTSGQITIDQRAIAGFDLTDLRRTMAIVPQEVMLFGGTIRENIAYGRPGATDTQITEAARTANALDFIEGFPEKFETIVGERGVKLSGGQRQRIAIARAILRDPKILILDEATSSLDAESEKLVQDALDLLMQNRTTIIIAHRLATIRNVDCIYVLREGAIAESGTHDELARIENGIYANLVKLQFELVEAQ